MSFIKEFNCDMLHFFLYLFCCILFVCLICMMDSLLFYLYYLPVKISLSLHVNCFAAMNFFMRAEFDSRTFYIGSETLDLINTSLQELSPITAHDTAGSFLLLGSCNGSINYIDMQKFPLRMKDNDLLVTELYRCAILNILCV